jgi:hypothetical protein
MIRKLNGENMNGVDSKMAQLINRYVSLEKEIQKLIYQAYHHYCEKCSSRCCREEMCRESIESSFLAMLVEEQGARYDARNGWMGPSGCRLAYGRPLVCYEFFCDDISRRHSFQNIKITEIVHAFTTIGARAHGSKHLLCIENLDIISSEKIEKMISKTGSVMNELANTAV